MNRNISEVETRLDAAGDIRPLAFTYEGQRIHIASYGRQWETEGGHHYLVMDPKGNVFELAYCRADNNWNLVRTPNSFGPQR